MPTKTQVKGSLFTAPPKGRKYSVGLSVTITEAEREYLDSIAAKSRMRISDLLRLGLQHVVSLHESGKLQHD